MHITGPFKNANHFQKSHPILGSRNPILIENPCQYPHKNFMTSINEIIPSQLYNGYRQFRDSTWREKHAQFESVAKAQHPDVMIIGCADSRVDPATIFSSGPGELFTLRNIAAIVPPYEQGGGQHGVSAAIEFAVCALGVRHIVVLGHGQCGGVAASLASAKGPLDGEFVPKWVAMAEPVRDRVLREHKDAAPEEQQRHAEYGTINLSLENLQSFPFIRERIRSGDLTLHGAWYSVYEGRLRWRDPGTSQFENITNDPVNQ